MMRQFLLLLAQPVGIIGLGLLLGLSLAVFLTAWNGHTPDSQAFAVAVERAVTDYYGDGQQKALAIDMRIDPKKLSHQLAGRMPLNALRLFGFTPIGFRMALLKRLGESCGAAVLTHSEREFIVGAARLGRRRMARIAPDLFHRKAASA